MDPLQLHFSICIRHLAEVVLCFYSGPVGYNSVNDQRHVSVGHRHYIIFNILFSLASVWIQHFFEKHDEKNYNVAISCREVVALSIGRRHYWFQSNFIRKVLTDISSQSARTHRCCSARGQDKVGDTFVGVSL